MLNCPFNCQSKGPAKKTRSSLTLPAIDQIALWEFKVSVWAYGMEYTTKYATSFTHPPPPLPFLFLLTACRRLKDTEPCIQGPTAFNLSKRENTNIYSCCGRLTWRCLNLGRMLSNTVITVYTQTYGKLKVICRMCGCVCVCVCVWVCFCVCGEH